MERTIDEVHRTLNNAPADAPADTPDDTPPTRREQARNKVAIRCMRCKTVNWAVVDHYGAGLTLHPCAKCKRWHCEFIGPDLWGELVQDPEDRMRVMIKRVDPNVIMRTPLWDTFVALLGAGMIKTGSGEMSNAWCAACVNEPHGDCQCACHAAWAYRREIESRETAGAK